MAGEPRRSFKRRLAGTVEDRTPRFLLGSLAIAMVIALVAGLGIGYAIGNDNSDSSPRARNRPTPTTRRHVTVRKGPISAVNGTVVRTGPRAVVVNVRGQRRTIVLVRLTRIEVTSAATRADIVAGAHVLFALRKPGATTTTGTASATSRRVPTAKEIIVVTGTWAQRMGFRVTSTSANSMTFVRNGKSFEVSTEGATIKKTIPGAKVNLTAGRHVLIKTYVKPAPKKQPAKKAKRKPVRRPPIALEILILPPASAFG